MLKIDWYLNNVTILERHPVVLIILTSKSKRNKKERKHVKAFVKWSISFSWAISFAINFRVFLLLREFLIRGCNLSQKCAKARSPLLFIFLFSEIFISFLSGSRHLNLCRVAYISTYEAVCKMTICYCCCCGCCCCCFCCCVQI